MKRKYEEVQAAKKAKKQKKPSPVHADWSDAEKAQYVFCFPSLRHPSPVPQVCEALHRAQLQGLRAEVKLLLGGVPKKPWRPTILTEQEEASLVTSVTSIIADGGPLDTETLQEMGKVWCPISSSPIAYHASGGNADCRLPRTTCGEKRLKMYVGCQHHINFSPLLCFPTGNLPGTASRLRARGLWVLLQCVSHCPILPVQSCLNKFAGFPPPGSNPAFQKIPALGGADRMKKKLGCWANCFNRGGGSPT